MSKRKCLYRDGIDRTTAWCDLIGSRVKAKKCGPKCYYFKER